MIKAIIFDLDGTLLDTTKDIQNALNQVLIKHHINPITLNETKSFLGYGAGVLVDKALKGNMENRDVIYKEYISHYEKNANIFTRPYDDMMELLSEIKPFYKLGVVSNKHQKALNEVIEYHFPNVFDIVIGESNGIPKKPDKAMLIKAIERLGIKINESIYIGDTEVDYLTAKNAYMQSIIVTYGFRSYDELKKLNAAIYVHNVKDLKELLRGMANVTY